ncbi:unnamed protein product [Pylaiella littoralis]
MAEAVDRSATAVSLDEGYLAWAEEELGVVIHHKLRVSSTPGREERGVFCEDDIPADTIVVSVPWETLMTIDSAKGTPFEGLMEVGAREDDVLCLLLLYHRHVLKDLSPLKKHMDVLPREYHQTIFYSDDELELLRGTSLHAVTVQWKTQVASDFRELEEMRLQQPSEAVLTVKDALVGSLTKEHYLWALGTVWSRFVTVEREGRPLKAMAPVFDMFNHDPVSETVHGFQESNQCLHLVTLQSWASGSEVKFSYGPLPNSRLLLLHGFCLPSNAFESVELWTTMEPGAPGYAAKQKILEDNGVDLSKRPFILTDKGLDPRLLPALRVQRATESELKVVADTPWGESLSARNEAEVCEGLCAALSEMLKVRQEGGLSSSSSSSNGPVAQAQEGRTATTTNAPPLAPGGGEVEGTEGGPGRSVLPEDRRRAVELLREGEERVLRFCLDWVEDYRLRMEQQLE